ncbi:MAG: AAA family ATPase, partial [Planctomycetota bacterium]
GLDGILTTNTAGEFVIKIAVLRKHLAGHAKSPRLTNKNIPKALEYIIEKLLCKNVEDRYPSAQQVIEDINRLAFKNFIPVSKELRKTYVMGGKFIGRETEMNQLKDYLALTKNRQTLRNGILLAGEAGTGKSRLVAEFKNYAQMGGFQFVHGACIDEKSEAYGPFIAILKQVVMLLEENHPLVKKYSEVLIPLMEGKTATSTFPAQEKDKIQFHISRFLLEASTECLFVLSIGDLHLANSLTRELLDRIFTALKEEVQGYPLLVISSYQTDSDNREALAWVEGNIMGGKFDLLPLHPLQSPEMGQLISSMLGIKAVAPYFIWKVEEITRGNPFFVTELMKTLIEENVVFQKGEIWQIGMNDLSKLKMPQSILKIFYRRIKKLSHESQQILHLIALYQSSMPVSLLRTILHAIPEKLLFEEIAHLLKKQFLVREDISGDQRYTLSNERLKTLLCDQISHVQTIQYHQEIADAILTSYAPQLYPYYESLAYHFSRSKNVAHAIDFCLRAGDKLKAQYANMEALNFYKQALSLFKQKEDPYPALREMARKISTQASAYIYEQIEVQSSEFPEAKKQLEVDLYPFLSRILGVSGEKKMETLKKMGQLNALLGKFDQAIDLYNSILTDDELYLGPEEKAHILGKIGSLHAQKGDISFALNCFERVEMILSRIGVCRETAMSKANLAQAYLSKGDYERTIQIAKQGLDILRNLPHSQPEDSQQFYSILGIGYFRKGDYVSSLKCFKQNLELSQKGNDSFVKSTSFLYLANVYHKQA